MRRSRPCRLPRTPRANSGSNRRPFEPAASSTDGFLTSRNDPVKTFKKVFDDYRQSYVLRYTPKGVVRDGWHEIKVEVPGHPRATVRARKGYFGGEKSEVRTTPESVRSVSALKGPAYTYCHASPLPDRRSCRDVLRQLPARQRAGLGAARARPRRRPDAGLHADDDRRAERERITSAVRRRQRVSGATRSDLPAHARVSGPDLGLDAGAAPRVQAPNQGRPDGARRDDGLDAAGTGWVPAQRDPENAGLAAYRVAVRCRQPAVRAPHRTGPATSPGVEGANRLHPSG